MDAEQQFQAFLDRYEPALAARARAILERLRGQLRGATEIVYDNFNALAVGFGPSEKASQAIVSIAVYPRWVNLFFLQNGPALHDPKQLLKGAGARVRHVRIDEAAQIDGPDVRALIVQALATARVPLDPTRPRRMAIRSVSARQRPRRA